MSKNTNGQFKHASELIARNVVRMIQFLYDLNGLYSMNAAASAYQFWAKR